MFTKQQCHIQVARGLKMADYFNVTTNLGDAEIAAAITNNTKLDITHIAFGDGNGAVPTPNKARTTLIREVHRQAVTKYERHATQANWIVIETVIPSSIGGFTIREMGIIANGKLISHGSHAPFEKVADLNGVSEYRLRFVQDITDAAVVAITLDQSLIYATQAWVETNYIRRNEVVDNLTSNDATKPVSAKQAKILKDNLDDAIYDLDVLAYSPIPYSKTIAPLGYLVMMGQTITQEQYPKLYSRYGANLPDMRGEFIRGLDNGRGVDSGREILSSQAATAIGFYVGGMPDSTLISFVDVRNPDTQYNDSTDGYRRYSASGDKGTAVQILKTVRPRNVSYNFIVKAG